MKSKMAPGWGSRGQALLTRPRFWLSGRIPFPLLTHQAWLEKAKHPLQKSYCDLPISCCEPQSCHTQRKRPLKQRKGCHAATWAGGGGGRGGSEPGFAEVGWSWTSLNLTSLHLASSEPSLACTLRLATTLTTSGCK